jgi:hypothetical protein
MTVLPSHMIPEGIHPVGKDYRLPHLADAEVALLKQDEATKVTGLFADYIVASLETLKG